MEEFNDSLNGTDGIPQEPIRFEGPASSGPGHFEGEGAQEDDQRDFVMISDSHVNNVQDSQQQCFNMDVNREHGMVRPEQLPGNYNYMNRLQNTADISRDTVSDFGNMDAYRRSGPEGSPAFQQSGGFLPSIGSDNESSVIFRPVRQLDFSALDETAQTEEMIPHGMNRSVSTPEHEVRGMSYLEREVCGSQADDENTRETSPETGFFELKSSPLHTSESEGELDSRVIFSPLNNGGMANMYNNSMAFEPNLNQGDVVHQKNPQTLEMVARSQYSPPSRPFDNEGSPRSHYQMSPITGHPVGKRSVLVNIPNDSGYERTEQISPNNKIPETVLKSQSPGLRCVDDLNIQNTSQSQSPQTQVFSSSLPPRLQNAQRSPVRNQCQMTSGIGSPQSMSRKMQSDKNVENSPHELHPTGKPRSDSLQGHNQRSELPLSDTAEPSQRLPSPSAWKIPGEQTKQTRNLFKEPKMTAPKRTGNAQIQNNKRPTMPAKNSQREVIHPVQKSRQEQAKQDTSGIRVKGQNSELRHGNSVGKRPSQVAGPPVQQQRGGPHSQPVGEDVARKGVSTDRKGNVTQRSTVTAGKKMDRSQQNYPSDYERKVEGSLHRNRSERSRTIGQVSSSSDRGAGIGEDSNSPHAGVHHPGINVVTQVQQYSRNPRPDEFGQRVVGKEQLIPHSNMDVHGGDSSVDVQGMENVRSQLQSMLKLSSDTFNETQQYNHVDSVSGLLMDMPQDPYLYQAPLDQSVSRGKEDASELCENFPSFTSRIWSDTSNVSRSDNSLHQENQRLRDMLEKERYRRKHCEQHIQKLNVKLLETQQQVAVAVSTDKRKDIMIEQLDKQLAKVVEGWKKRDDDKEEYIKQIEREKTHLEENLSKQQSITANFEQDMSRAVNEIRLEKEDAILTVQKLRTEAEDHERTRLHLEDVIKSERERTELMEQEWQKVRENRELNEMKVQQLQDRLHKEQDEWFKREQELLQRVEEVTEKNIKIVQQERTKNAELEHEVKELEEKRQKSQTDIKRLEMDIDVVSREKESLKVEMGIMEDKYETSQRALEAELHSQMQKEIASQIADVHKRMEEEEETLRENHRHQVMELGQRHKREMEKQLARYHDDLKNREDESRKLYQEYEQKLHDSRTEITSLQSTKQKLESQRSEILTKLQYMMQSQWNEAVSLLSGSPNKKKPPHPNSSFLSMPGRSEDNVQSYHQSDDLLVNNLTTDTADHNPVGVSESGPFNPELSLADFSTSLHIQQLLQSLSHPGVRGAGSFEGVSGSTYDQSSSKPDISQTVNTDRTAKVGTSLQQTTALNSETCQMSSNPQTMNQELFRNPDTSQTMVNSEDYQLSNSAQLPFQNTDRFHVPDMTQRSDLYNKSVHNWLHEATITSLQPTSTNSSDWSTQQAKMALAANQQQQQQQQPPPVAVPIRPPQQHSSEAQHYEQTPDSSISEHPSDWSQPGHSPPTKLQGHHRIREDRNLSDGDLATETAKLDVDYSQLSDRLEEHESRQGQLQHYIQMLLQKTPGEASEDGDIDYGNSSQLSQDQTEELDLNDTAQAAQLQRELTRIQQLRDGKAASVGNRQSITTPGNSYEGVLSADQLAEISKLLGQQTALLEQPQASQQDMEQITELMEVLKGLNVRQPTKRLGHPLPPRGVKKTGAANNISPRSPPQVSHKDVAKVKRNLKVAMTGIAEGQGQTASKALPGSQVKKPERKVAPVAAAGVRPSQGKVKSAWK
ncbi:protein lava lamp-like [Ylistrum balloti]|uniref:protein lava lamp-like n=1 Tax=Ylistrum balloti TaxID=509963 RepID=UPI002905C9BE|nr:protein lava lamp-like [Ylistrum balloti]